jgi:DNA-binding beta-propeller fold protein YncE
VLITLSCTGEEMPIPTASYTVTKSGTGFGTVASTAGFDCGPTCPTETQALLVGNDFTLTATAETGSTFEGWSGPGCAAGASASTTASTSPSVANNVCDASFALLPGTPRTLQVTKSGTGQGTVTSTDGAINCGSGAGCSAEYPAGTVVQLTASASGGSTFGGWSGAACLAAGTPASQNPVGVTMDVSRTCDARFDTSPSSGRLSFYAAFRLDRRSEGMSKTGTPNRLVIGTFEAPVGQLREIDYTNPASPMSLTGIDCGINIRDVGFIPAGRGPVAPLVQGSSVDGPSCASQTPLGGIVLGLLGSGRAQYRWIPNTDFAAQALFFGTIQIDNLVTGIPRTVTLSTGRNCVFSLATNDSLIVGVGREGIAGTATENCNNERKSWFVGVSTAMVQWSLDLGGAPRDAALTPDGLWAFVANYGLGVVHRIDIRNRMMAGTFTVPTAVGVEVDPTGRYLAATNFDGNRVHVFDLTTNMEIANEDTRGGGALKALWTDQSTAADRTLVVQNFQDSGQPGGSLAFFRFTY